MSRVAKILDENPKAKPYFPVTICEGLLDFATGISLPDSQFLSLEDTRGLLNTARERLERVCADTEASLQALMSKAAGKLEVNKVIGFGMRSFSKYCDGGYGRPLWKDE